MKQQGEKKETPQERLKRIMNRQLNKQSMFKVEILVITSIHSSWSSTAFICDLICILFSSFQELAVFMWNLLTLLPCIY